jgi:hypothetical protein
LHLFKIDNLLKRWRLYWWNIYLINMFKWHIKQIYHVWEGYFRKIPVERRKISRAEWRRKFSIKTGIFRKYPSQTWYICLIIPNII